MTIIVKSFAENEMEVELSNYPEVGMTTTNTYVRRYPTTAQGIENTNWKVKMNVPWVNAITDELTRQAISLSTARTRLASSITLRFSERLLATTSV